jgi:hypothetical protein
MEAIIMNDLKTHILSPSHEMSIEIEENHFCGAIDEFKSKVQSSLQYVKDLDIDIEDATFENLLKYK